MTSNGALLSLNDVSVDYRSGAGIVKPLVDVTFSVQAGEFIVVVGESGAGKSTLLHFVAGFLRPQNASRWRVATRWLAERSARAHIAGKISIGAEDVTDLEPWRRDIGLVMQRFSLYPHLSIKENLAFPLRLRRVPRRAREDAIEDVSQILGIKDELGKMPSDLSGGQQQRVAIGKVLLRDPAVVLMDEPFSHLDWRWRRTLRCELVEHLLVESRKKRCVLFVTHDLDEAQHADRIVVLTRGNIGTGDLKEVRTAFRVYEGKAWKELKNELERG
jgi:ABC-type sugar transport system ATPase subunit